MTVILNNHGFVKHDYDYIIIKLHWIFVITDNL